MSQKNNFALAPNIEPQIAHWNKLFGSNKSDFIYFFDILGGFMENL